MSSVCLAAASCALSFAAQVPTIAANQNRIPAGTLQNHTLELNIEIRRGVWHPEAEDGPTLYVEAFGETGKPAQIPGPLVRVSQGTTIHVTVKNTLTKNAAKVYGFVAHPSENPDPLEVPAGEAREVTFEAGAPGTYFYWARTEDFKPKVHPILEDAQLNGAFVVDPPGEVAPDRIFVMNQMFPQPDVTHPGFEVVTINGKLYPFTERLEYTQGESVRWRVINASCCQHPMHLHGNFFKLMSLGSFSLDTAYPPGELQSVVTQSLAGATTMMMEWSPKYPGLWLFHCHLHAHISDEERVPYFMENINAKPLPPDEPQHDGMPGMHDMAGLVLAITVKPSPHDAPTIAPTLPAHKIDLIVEPTVASGKLPAFACSVRDGKKLIASLEKSMGPPIVVTLGEPVEITIVNHLKDPTTIHWHGLELESYYDGVMGGGTSDHITPAIAPGASFTARFTPTRAGTFIYHTHSPLPQQLTDGIYGPLIVLSRGESFNPEHDRVVVIGTRDADFYAKRLTLNGEEDPTLREVQHGQHYRLRIINIAPELFAQLKLGNGGSSAIWLPIAKDGADLPARMVKPQASDLRIDSGETYDFDWQPTAAGDMSLEIRNRLNVAALKLKIRVE
ncbi:MAG TPA: multicopper oxidase domain-containing protein [Candidatus Koribacter sp.]